MRKMVRVLLAVGVAGGIALFLLRCSKEIEPKELTLIYTHNVIGEISASG